MNSERSRRRQRPTRPRARIAQRKGEVAETVDNVTPDQLGGDPVQRKWERRKEQARRRKRTGVEWERNKRNGEIGPRLIGSECGVIVKNILVRQITSPGSPPIYTEPNTVAKRLQRKE